MFTDLLAQIDSAAASASATFDNLWGIRQGVRETVAPTIPQTNAGGSNGTGHQFSNMLGDNGNIAMFLALAAGGVIVYKLVK